MTVTQTDSVASDLAASDVAWNLEPLLGDTDVDAHLAAAAAIAGEVEQARGTIASLDAVGLASVMNQVAQLQEHLGRAGSYAGLAFTVDTADAERGALMQRVDEESTAIATRVIFFELEWAAVPDDAAEVLLNDARLAFCAHSLRSARRYRPHLLTEPEEKILADKDITGAGAWSRLFSELTSAITIDLDGETVALEQGLSRLQSPNRDERALAAAAVTEGLAPGLRTRAFVFNTLLADKSSTDRLRSHDSWIQSRNLANEASDESVQALVEAVVSRYDIPQRWYALKARLLGVDQLADYDRSASVADAEAEFGWDEARTLVLDAYASFSPELADVAQRFFNESWIDAPMRPGKRPGAFCAYTVPSHHPYLFLNWTSSRRDVLTLAHEMGHGLHAYMARDQGIFHQTTPLTLAETASVFGETVTFGRMMEATTEPNARLALIAESLEGQIATVFRQIAMNRFEDRVHVHRRETGELSTDDFAQHWAETQTAMLGDAVEITEGYRTWWSYIPHFIGTPGYVYAYAYGQLLALSVYRRYEEGGADFVPAYLELLAAGGSKSPEELGKIVDCDLGDPEFWVGGLNIIEQQLEAAETAALLTGRISIPAP